jgi:hypothetical protein
VGGGGGGGGGVGGGGGGGVGGSLPPPPPPPPAIQDDEAAIRAAAVSAAPALEDAAIGLTVERLGARGAPVTVSLRYASSVRVPFVGWLFGATIAMPTSMTARQEFG